MLSTEGQQIYRPAPARQGRRRRGRVLAAVDGDAAPLPRTRSTSSSTCTRCTWPARSSSAGTARSGSSPSTWPAPPPGRPASFVFGGDAPSVGASGAIFGLFGILLAAGRIHHPVDRQSRGVVSQLMFLVIINIVFGFASGGPIDNAAHLGGLAAGLWLGALIPPTGVPTMSSLWHKPGETRAAVGPGDGAGVRVRARDRGRRRRRGRGRRVGTTEQRVGAHERAGRARPTPSRVGRAPASVAGQPDGVSAGARPAARAAARPPRPRPTGSSGPRRCVAISPDRRIRSRTDPRTWPSRSSIAQHVQLDEQGARACPSSRRRGRPSRRCR